MSAYLISYITVTDPVRIKDYQAGTPAVVAKFGGKFLVRGGEKTTLEGPEEGRRVVLIEFPSREKAQAFWDSREYQDLKRLREGAATFQMIIVDGVT
jgi:uncharacterized protein (DUF1330 family)